MGNFVIRAGQVSNSCVGWKLMVSLQEFCRLSVHSIPEQCSCAWSVSATDRSC
jgi:hypothetical protein